MNMLRKLLAIFIASHLILGIIVPLNVVFADPQEAVPLNLDLSTVDDQLEIGFDTYEGYYVGLKWDPPQSWSSDISATRYYSLWTSEDGISFVKYPETIPGEQTYIRINKHGNQALEPGKIYYAYLLAEHVHTDPGTGTETRHQSIASNRVLFMTTINVDVTTSGPNSINIKWDDVKLGSARIDYDIYISESNYFGQTTPLSIRQENIGEGRPVRPVPGENKLVYTRTGLRTGTLYYVMIKPIVSDPRVRFVRETQIQSGATRIIARILRVSDDFWRLEWNPITNADMDPDKQISYYIKRGDLSQGDNPIEETLGQTRDTKMSVRASDELCYYRIVAFVETQTGEAVEVRSDRILAIESEIPAVPPVPDLKDEIEGSPAFSYKNSLTPTQATLAWTVPQTPDGNLDTNIVYDIWLVTDPADFDNPRTQPVKANYSVPVSDYITESKGSQTVVAYKYTFTGLTANTSYYARIVAKKMYTKVNPEGLIEDIYYQSEPALRVITTPIEDAINRPVAPSKPPFRIKTTDDGRDEVGTDFVTVTWKNDWYEYWDTTDELNPSWTYVEEPGSIPESVYGGEYRHISYDSNITFQIGYTEYSPNINYEQLKDMPMKVLGITNNIQKVDQEYKITGLEPNTVYIIWLRAARTMDLVSEPSDPLMAVTTISEHDPGAEKPVVPNFLYGKAGDTFIDLGWNVKDTYEYNLKYSTSDNINSASNTVKLAGADLNSEGIYRVEGLTQNTVYYFWIQASVTSAGAKISESDWSDSFAVKTLEFLPPDAPSGFGIKNIDDGIGKNHIIFEWLTVPGMEYILEISPNSDFADSIVYSGIKDGEMRVEGLKSNSQYYARLYSFDVARNKRSESYAGVIRVNTLKSSDEYDSDVNITEPLEEDAVEKFISNRVWKYLVSLSNADSFIQTVRKSKDADFVINLSNPSRTVNSRIIEIPKKVFDFLATDRKNIIIDTGDCVMTVRPGIFSFGKGHILNRLGDYFIRFEIKETESKKFEKNSKENYKSAIISLGVEAVASNEAFEIESFERPLLIDFVYKNSGSASNIQRAYAYDDFDLCWNKLETTVLFNEQLSEAKAIFELNSPAVFTVLEVGSGRFIDITNLEIKNAVDKLATAHELRSISGDFFRPTENITLGEAVRLVLDVCDYNYNGDEFSVAAKSGITRHITTKEPNEFCSRQEVIAMVVRAYEIKTGVKAQSDFSIKHYIDSNFVDQNLLPMIRFAVEKGIAVSKSRTELAPHQPVTRGDFIIMLSNIAI